MKRKVLFVQGAGEGAHEEDKRLAESLQNELGAEYEVRYPEMPDEDNPEDEAWRNRISQELLALDGEVILVGHSVGGSLLLEYLSVEEVAKRVAGAFLISPPYWDAVEDFAPKLPGELPPFFYHSRDDEVVPFVHLALYRERFPQARFRELDGRGHQLNDDLSEVALDIKGL